MRMRRRLPGRRGSAAYFAELCKMLPYSTGLSVWKLFGLTRLIHPSLLSISTSVHPSPLLLHSTPLLHTRHKCSTSSHPNSSHISPSTPPHLASTESDDSQRGSQQASGSAIPQRLRGILSGVIAGNRAKLAEAITLVESKHSVKHHQAQWLLTEVLSHRSKQRQLGQLKPSFRLGVSGPPGAGKSTVIEKLGQFLTGQGHRVAVLAVDPSSVRTGGSIMADKTRMSQLSQNPRAYIRPSPSGGSLGGVTRTTNEAISLCEGAGYDVIVVETVGVGQSETAVYDMTDMFLLLVPPAAGDELQGIKRGIVELADLVVVNKADGDLLPAARRIAADYTSALKLLHAKKKNKLWRPTVMMASAQENSGIEAVWDKVQAYRNKMESAGELEVVRRAQQRRWLWSHVSWQLMARFRQWPGMAELATAMENRVVAGSMAPGTAADLLLDEFFSQRTVTRDK